MALQDLTPQLRTRLSRVARLVGWFVFLATALLIFGFCYYIYKTAQRKGWFTAKYHYQTSLNNAAGLKVGDPVKLMGNPVGSITKITPNEPDAYYGITVDFDVLKPFYGYIWDDSKVVISSDLLGNRFLEVTKGVAGVPTIQEDTTNKVAIAMLRRRPVRALRQQVLSDVQKDNPQLQSTNLIKFNWIVRQKLWERMTNNDEYYTNLTSEYWIAPDESPAWNDQLQKVATQLEQALPNILSLTNKIAEALDNTIQLTSNLNAVAVAAQPLLTNLSAVSSQLNGPGTLGTWLLSSNMNMQLEGILTTANTNLPALFDGITGSLTNLANMTENLRVQVEANPTMLGSISKTVIDTDDFVQGLKRHWLLRSAFKTTPTNTPPPSPSTYKVKP
jgi:ABC-type transporter Mla subunit MlaD